MNLLLSLLLVWVFSWAEDVVLKRHLKSNLRAEAGGFEGVANATAQFDERASAYSWITLGLGLSLVTLSFPDQFTVSWSGLSFAAGVLLCLSYIVEEIRAYAQVSKAVKASRHRKTSGRSNAGKPDMG